MLDETENNNTGEQENSSVETLGTKTDVSGEAPNPGADVGTAQGNENPGDENPSIKETGTPAETQDPPVGTGETPNTTHQPNDTEGSVEQPNEGKAPETPTTEPGDEIPAPPEDTAPEGPEPYDHEGKIKITDVEYDKVDGKHLKKLVKKSHINQHYKKNLYAQIKSGKIDPEYVHMVRMIISAHDKGSVYSGTLEG